MPRDLLAEAPRAPRDLLADLQPAPQPQAAPDKGASVLADTPTPHKGYAAQVREMGAAGPSKGAAMPWGQIGQQWADTAGGAATGIGLGVPSAVVGAPGDIEAVGRFVGNAFDKNIPRETVLPTSSGVMNAVAGEPANEQVAAGRMVGSMASPAAYSKGAELAGKAAGFGAKHVLGWRTGAGAQSVEEAYKAGKEGGPGAQAFVDQMRGNAPSSDVVDAARDAVAQLRAERGAAYRAGIGNTIKNDATVLDFAPVNDAITKTSDIGAFKGVSTIPGAQKVREKISELVNQWQSLDPAEYHTPEGMDALKQAVWNLRYDGELSSVAGPGKPGAKILDAVGNAIKGQIVKQAPGYADVMKDYQTASEELKEIEGTLSLNPKARVDTSLRKLQSIMRNNANTNYGARAELGQRLQDAGDGTLMPGIAGQMMSAKLPRGLSGPEAGIEASMAVMSGHPHLLPALLASSPRLIGEAAYGAGRLGRGAQEMTSALSKAAHINSATAPALIGNQQLLARLLAQQPAPASR